MTKEGLNTALNVLCLAAQQCQHAVQVVSPFMIFAILDVSLSICRR